MVAASEVTDHVVPHRGDPAVFWDVSNLQPLCRSCHDSRKQRIERRGWADDCGEDGMPLDPRHPFNSGEVRGAV